MNGKLFVKRYCDPNLLVDYNVFISESEELLSPYFMIKNMHEGAFFESCAEDWPPGTSLYISNGFIHCNTGPAVIFYNGNKQYYLKGELVTAEDVFNQLSPEQQELELWKLHEWV